MYRAYWGMAFNPFDKEIPEKQFYHGTDYNEMMKRLEYLKMYVESGFSPDCQEPGRRCARGHL